MDLTLTEDQRMIRSMAREFLEKECPTTLVREMEADEKGYPESLWQQMAELGWTGLALPEQYGGAGMTLQDLAILVEEHGRHMVPGPFFPSVVLGGTAISEFGSDRQKAEWLPGIADGSSVFTYAGVESNGRWDVDGIETEAKTHGDSIVLNGAKAQVPFAHAADGILVAARAENGPVLVVVDANSDGLTMEPVPTVGADHASTIRFDGVEVPADNALGDKKAVERINDLGAAAKCAEMVGGAQRVLEMSLQFVQERKAFGKPIGTFQAIQHHCANMVTDVDGARLITSEAIWSLANGDDGAMDVSVAKTWVGDACRRAMFAAHQVHGAIGYTKEHDLQLYTRRSKSAELAFGDSAHHRERVASGLGM